MLREGLRLFKLTLLKARSNQQLEKGPIALCLIN